MGTLILDDDYIEVQGCWFHQQGKCTLYNFKCFKCDKMVKYKVPSRVMESGTIK
jgi:hypothetical protein